MASTRGLGEIRRELPSNFEMESHEAVFQGKESFEIDA